jgi:FkbM family methyltransferase
MISVLSVFRVLRRRLCEYLGISIYSKPSLNDIDNKLSKYLPFRGGFFIETGANDGISQSNTYYLEKLLGWHGLLIEAVPELHAKCVKRRHHSKVYKCALVSDTYPDTSIEMDYAHLMSAVEGSRKAADAQIAHIEEGVRIQRLTSTYRFITVVRTLSSILDEFPQPIHIDFFSLDVEGYELQVLQGMNIEKYRPTYILVEANFFDEVDRFLSPWYDLIDQFSDNDFLYRVRATIPCK